VKHFQARCFAERHQKEEIADPISSFWAEHADFRLGRPPKIGARKEAKQNTLLGTSKVTELMKVFRR
jgi:hypothetical protein